MLRFGQGIPQENSLQLRMFRNIQFSTRAWVCVAPHVFPTLGPVAPERNGCGLLFSLQLILWQSQSMKQCSVLKRIVAGSLFIIVCAKLTAAPQATEWKDYSYCDDAFSISSPIPPKLTQSNFKTPLGDPTHESIYDIDLSPVNFFVVDVLYLTASDIRTPQRILLDYKDKALQVIDGKLLSQKPIFLDGFPGLQIEFRSEFGGRQTRTRTRVFVVNKRVYAISSYAYLPAALPPDTDRFLDSFHRKSCTP
jgi:hypothetical protein